MIEEAASTTEDEMKSSLVTGVEAIYDIEELKIRLGERKEQQDRRIGRRDRVRRASLREELSDCKAE